MMHRDKQARALGIRDILGEMFLHLHPGSRFPFMGHIGDDRDNSTALATCARKSFSEPALDVLWHSLPDSIPLLSILSAFQKIPAVEAPTARDRFLSERSELIYVCIPAELQCCDVDHLYHRCFVEKYPALNGRDSSHTLDVSGSYTAIAIDPLVYQILFAQNDGQPILPLVRELHYQPECRSDMTIPFFGSRSLLKVVVDFDPPLVSDIHTRLRTQNALEMIFRNIYLAAPHLEHLTFLSFDLCNSVRQTVPTGAFGHLKHLHVTTVSDWAFVQSLSALSQLTYLEAKLDFQDTIFSQCSGFPMLRVLVISGTLSDITLLLTNIYAPSLQTVNSKDPSLTDIPYFTTLSTRFRSLCEISITFWYPMGAALFPDAIQPLLDLNSLSSITLKLFDVDLSLAVSDVEVMAKSWPHLARFCFGGSISTPTLPEVTILIAFAELFPALKELTLHLDVTTVPSGNSIPILSHGLQKLQIGCYDIPNPVLLAQFIDSIFPYIATDSSPWLAGSWEKVLGFVQQFQLSRQQQMKRMLEN